VGAHSRQAQTNDAIVIDDSGDKNGGVSEDAGRSNPQDVLAQPLLSKGPLKGNSRFNKHDFNSFFFPSSRLVPHCFACQHPQPSYWGDIAQIGGMEHWLSCFDHFCLVIAV
jgi:hypothetical protein